MIARLSAVLILLTIVSGIETASAQEFNCSVSVIYRNLSGSDYTFLDELEQRALEYINQRRWTDDDFEEEERIDCSMQIFFSEAITLTQFRARLVLATRRPIYGTVQQATVIQIADEEWQFEYSQGTPLTFEPDRYHPLTSVLNYYAYLMLGYDYDTFDELGGQPHFEKAQRVAEIAEQTGAAGWSSLSGDQSRGELIAQIMDPRFRVLRSAYFGYHYRTLDHFIEDADDARSELLTIVQNLLALREDVTRAYYLDQFFSVKYREIANVFRGSQEAAQAFDALSQMDPAHLTEYSQMMN